MAGITIGMSSGVKFEVFEWIFTTFFGIGTGLMMILCLEILWEHFYHYRGYVTGFVYFSKYFGTFFFSLLASYLINPTNEEPKEKFEEEEFGYLKTRYIYSKEIGESMVDLWIIFFFFFVALIYCGVKLTTRVKRKVQINISMLYT